jgi:hypothetical protein
MSRAGGFVSFCIVLYRVYCRGAGRSTRYFRPLFSPPALRKRLHGSFARRLVAVRRMDIAAPRL